MVTLDINRDTVETTALETAVTGFIAFPFACAAAVVVGTVAPAYGIPALVVFESGALALGAHSSIRDQRE